MADLAEQIQDSSRRSLEDLSPEILLLIFEEIYSDEGSDGCKPLRLVSRKFCMGTAPFFYRDLNFKSGQPSKSWTPAFRAQVEISAQNAYKYARNARIDSRLNWDAMSKYLSKCRRLERLDWAYWDDITPNTSPIPPPIQDFLRTKSPPVRLYTWRCSIPNTRGLPPLNLNTPQHPPHIASIPTSNLVGLSLTRPVWRGRDAHEAMIGLITSSPQLESLEVFRMNNKFLDRNPDTCHPSCSRDLAPPLLRLAQARLSFGSGLLTHLTRHHRLLTRGPKRPHFPARDTKWMDLGGGWGVGGLDLR